MEVPSSLAMSRKAAFTCLQGHPHLGFAELLRWPRGQRGVWTRRQDWLISSRLEDVWMCVDVILHFP